MKLSQQKALDEEQKLRAEVTKLFPIQLRRTAPEQVDRILNEWPGILDIVHGHNIWNEHASHLLADSFADGYFWIRQSDKKAFNIWEKLALEGDIEAQYCLWVIYCTWIWSEQNYEKAFEWFLKSAEQGDIEAQFRLGYMYCLGHWTKQNYEKALEWFSESAKQGNEYAKTAYIMCNTASKWSKRMQHILFGWGFLNPNESFSCVKKVSK